MHSRFRISLLAAISLLLLAGCSPFIRLEQPVQNHFIVLEGNDTLGQSFTAGYDGFNGIALYLKPGSSQTGYLELSVFSVDQLDAPALRNTSLIVAKVDQPGYYRFNFVPIPDSAGQDYYLQAHLTSEGELMAGCGPPESYLNGSLYLDGQAREAQLTFRLAYDRTQALVGIGQESLVWFGLTFAAILLFVLPGWGILSWGLPDWDNTWWAGRVGLSAGLSLAIYPILFLWTDLVGLHLGAWYAWLPLGAGLGLIGVRLRKSLTHPLRFSFQLKKVAPELVMLGLIALLMLSRLWVIRSLLVPMWGDSIQHTMITQLLIDHKGLFDSWQPYSPSTSFTYHFGFHALAAAFHWLTGMPAEQATLWTGQFVNSLAVIGLVPWAVRLGRNRWAGVGALLVAGLLTTMPQSYVNWGRYTQLAGQTILLAAVYFGWNLFVESHKHRRQIVLTGLMMAGLALTHYRVLIFGGLFFAVVLLLESRRRTILAHISRVSAAGILAGVIFLPWFIHVFAGTLITTFSAQISTPASQVAQITQESNTIGNLFEFLPPMVWVLSLIGLAWGLWQRDKGAAIIGTWWFLNLLAANPGWFNLPGTGVIGSFSVLIAFYIPAAILVGAAVGWLFGQINQSAALSKYGPDTSIITAILIGLAILGVGLYGARQRLGDFKPTEAVLFTRPDQRAANWIQENIPKDAIFLVNSFYVPHWNLVVGSDGGWWLPLEAGRDTTLPPITYTTEEPPGPDYIQRVNDLTLKLADSGFDRPDIRDLLAGYGVTHVYIGQRHGAVNNPGPVIDAGQLLAHPGFIPIYRQDRVWIFQVVY